MEGFEPLRNNTRYRFDEITTRAWSSGAQLEPVKLPNVGLAAGLLIQLRGTMTLSSAGALANLGPWNITNRFYVSANLGQGELINLTGYGAYLLNAVLERGYAPDKAGSGDTTISSDIYAAPVASGGNTWVLTYYLPFNLNDGDNYEIGLLNLQSFQTEVQLTITCGVASDAATNTSSFTGTYHVAYVYVEVPDINRVALPPLTVVKALETQTSITAVGQTAWEFPKMGTIFQDIMMIRLNGSRSDSINEFLLKINRSDQVYKIDRQFMKWMNRKSFGLNFPTGVYVWDFFHARGQVNSGDFRDAIDTEGAATIENIVDIDSGATLGSNNNYFNNIRRLVQVLELPASMAA